jgi:hypothetical protein
MFWMEYDGVHVNALVYAAARGISEAAAVQELEELMLEAIPHAKVTIGPRRPIP